MLCFKIQKRFRFFFKYTLNKANVFVPGSCLHTLLNIIHQFLCGVQNHRFLRTRYLPHPKFILILQVYFILKDIKTLVINIFLFTPSFIYEENKFHYKEIFSKITNTTKCRIQKCVWIIFENVSTILLIIAEISGLF